MTQKTLTKQDLSQFTGTEQWYRHSMVANVLYTDGVKYLAQHGGAYWLVDEIAFAQGFETVSMEEFQVWKLTVHSDQTAVLACEDGNSNICFSKRISFTDFPLESIELYFLNNVILLPSEY